MYTCIGNFISSLRCDVHLVPLVQYNVVPLRANTPPRVPRLEMGRFSSSYGFVDYIIIDHAFCYEHLGQKCTSHIPMRVLDSYSNTFRKWPTIYAARAKKMFDPSMKRRGRRCQKEYAAKISLVAVYPRRHLRVD